MADEIEVNVEHSPNLILVAFGTLKPGAEGEPCERYEPSSGMCGKRGVLAGHFHIPTFDGDHGDIGGRCLHVITCADHQNQMMEDLWMQTAEAN